MNLFARTSMCLWAVALVHSAVAGPEPDLQHITPVPGDQPIPVADFFRPPRFDSPKLNPEGGMVAAMIATGVDKTGLLVIDLANKRTRFLRASATKDVYAIHWLGADRILFSVSQDKLYAEGMFVANARDLTQNYPVESFSSTLLVAVPPKTPRRPLIWIRSNAYDNREDTGVVQINADKSITRNYDAMPGSFQDTNRDTGDEYNSRASIVRAFSKPKVGTGVDYLATPDGELAFAITASDGVFNLFRYVKDDPASCPVDLDLVYPVGCGERLDELIVIGPRREGKPRVLQRLDAASGELGAVLCEDAAYDMDGVSLYRRPVTGQVLGARYGRSMRVSVWFDEAYRSYQQALEATLAKQVVAIIGSDDKERRFLVAAYSDRQPVNYLLFDPGAKSLELLEKSMPWIDPARMRPMGVIRFKTRDGISLEAYLTLPGGASKEKPVPLVVLPHGGPWVRDTWGFDPEVQFLASRGYAVLQPNYRGSTGYDWLFPAADQWAFRKMHDDVTDAVRTVLRTGLVDARRIGIMGTSFGGYLAVCGVAFEPELYRCAVTVAGVFDWAQVMAEARYDRFITAKFGILRRHLGDYRKQAEEFATISPLRHVEHVQVPVLVAHGTADDVADVQQSRALIAELEKYSVPHEAMLVRGEGHGMSKLENEIRLYSKIEAFLARHLAGAADGAAATASAP